MHVVTRFAPSPTGFLHIGGARTALFNWLFARRHQGRFLLRIEDTDRERSTDAAVEAILDGMRWLGLDWDGEVVHQFARMERHAEVARQLLDEGKAYRCFASQAELAALREQGKPYDRAWRDRGPADAPGDQPFAVRLKSPLEGEVIVRDHVRGEVRVAAKQLEDLVILRSDGTPTYNLAVVVDDHDMGVTHIIRGDDHLTNAAKQSVMYEMLGWHVPEFAHIPLIHGADGAKLSKRHGALGVDAYREMGYLPEALRNYLLRLGWAHGDDEIIPTAQAVEWFNLENIGQSASRFDFVKLENLNGHYLREADDAELANLILPRLKVSLGTEMVQEGLALARLTRGMAGLKQRAKTVNELAASAAFYVRALPLPMTDKARGLLGEEGKRLLAASLPGFRALATWSEEAAQAYAKPFAEAQNVKLGALAQPLRAALTGSHVSPGVFEVMEVLGREESVARLERVYE